MIEMGSGAIIQDKAYLSCDINEVFVFLVLLIA